MKKYSYTENQKIRELQEKIKSLRVAYQTLNFSQKLNKDLLRQSLLKSALFSARIEGNPLSLSEVSGHMLWKNSKDLHKKEVFNLLSAYRFINFQNSPKNFSVNLILKFHQLVMEGISGRSGKFRKEPSAIFNQAGVAVYLAPSHFLIEGLIKDLVFFVLKSPEPNLIKAAIAQFTFEKIHPFIDGNGRVGRLISAFILAKKESFDLVSCLEEYIDEHRNQYYYALEPAKDATLFVEFFLEALLETAKKNFVGTELKDNKAERALLLPRREELLAIIREHPDCSFNFISRRFGNVNVKTLHYDLKKLQEEGLILKVGKTRGSLYRAKS